MLTWQVCGLSCGLSKLPLLLCQLKDLCLGGMLLCSGLLKGLCAWHIVCSKQLICAVGNTDTGGKGVVPPRLAYLLLEVLSICILKTHSRSALIPGR